MILRLWSTRISKFNYIVCFIKESNDLDTMNIDELYGSLLVYKQRMSEYKDENQTLKVVYDERTTKGKGKGAFNSFRGTRDRGRGRPQLNKELIECYKCHKLGHFHYECSK